MWMILFKLIGGLALLLYGMDLASEGLQKFAAQRLRAILNLITRNRVWALLLGTLVTLMLQSSSATTVMLVSFVTSSLVSLGQAFPILLGANIGTTFTVQILAFNLSDFALLAVALGFLAMKFFKGEQIKYFGMGLMGFGFIFYGMELMDQAVEPLKNSEFLSKGLSWVCESFWLGLLAGTVCTLIIQSSAATIVFVMSLVSQGLMSPQDSVAIVLGANLATCDSAILASLTRGSKAWRLALGYLFIRMVSIAFIYFVLPWFQELIRILTHFLAGSMDPVRYVANTHTFFNIIASLALLPFTGLIVKMVQFIIPTRRPPEIFDFRKEGLQAAEKAIMDMTRRVAQMMTMTVKAFRDNDLKALRKVLDADEEIDLINWQMKQGLMAREKKEGENDDETLKFLWVAAQLEHIGDVLSKDAVELARKKIYEGLEFSGEGQAELENFYRMVYNLFEKAFSAFIQDDKAAAQEVLSGCEEVKKMKWQMHISHLRRFGKGIQETLNTSAIHMDLITDLERICDHSTSVAKEVLQ